MIEAINASISNAQTMRAVAEEASTSQSANPVRIQKAGVTAPYLSPHVRLSPNTKPIFVVRDVDTGAQLKQFPSEAQIRAYQKASQAQAQLQSTATGETREVTPEQARILIKTSVEYKEERAAVQFDKNLPLPGTTQTTADTPAPVPGAKSTVDQQA